MSINPGTVLGPYEIVSAIGAGGMGEVYKARDTRLNRDVAIKILPASFSSRPEMKQRFEREAQTIAGLNHPHICVLHDVGHQDGLDYLVMEYLEGGTLEERIAKGPLPVEEAMNYATQIADALDKAHRRGVTHRDLKPGNIMITAPGRSFWISALPSCARERPRGLRSPFQRCQRIRKISRPMGRSSARSSTWRPSSSKARRPTLGQTSLRWARSSTR